MHNIEELAGDGKLSELKLLFEKKHTQLEIDVALENALAYSQIETAEYLLSLGANFSNYNYQSVYYAVHNNELEGLKYAISKGVDINIQNGMILNTCIITVLNTKSLEMLQWTLDNGADISLLTEQSLELIDTYRTEKLKEMILK